MMLARWISCSALFVVLSSLALGQGSTQLMDFESPPKQGSWLELAPGIYDRQSGGAQSGEFCLRLEPKRVEDGPGVRAFRHRVDAAAWRGQVVRARVAIRSSVLAEKTSGWLDLRVKRPGHASGLAASRRQDAVTSPDWTNSEITFGVAKDAEHIDFILVQSGAEPVWFDDFELRSIGRVGDESYGEWIEEIPLHQWNSSPAQLVEMISEPLSDFWGRAIKVRAGVVAPADYDGEEKLPICYSVHGFGGSHLAAWRRGADLQKKMADGYPRMIYVFLDASCPMGHHVFADSVNTGPWGTALTKEFIPGLEGLFGGARASHQRFLTGHSSGGWSTLWLQLTNPEFFGGTWSTAPDPVDFREFTNVNVYRDENAYVDSFGEARPLVRRDGRILASLEEFTRREVAQGSYGGQMASFDAVFSPKGDDGRPQPLFDRKSGLVDLKVAQAWQAYDIGIILRDNWPTLAPILGGKIRVWIGTEDTFYLDRACQLLAKDMAAVEANIDFLFVEGRDHSDLFAPHQEHWPQGLLERIHREMLAASERGEGTGDAELDALFAEIDSELSKVKEPVTVSQEDQGGS